MNNREIDALVAEKIMELQVLGFMDLYPDFTAGGESVPWDNVSGSQFARRAAVYLGNHCCCAFAEHDYIRWFGHIPACLEVVPRYSENIAAAWQVVEKFVANGREVGVTFSSNTYIATGWYVDIGPSNGFDHFYEANSETAPRAICLAALRAVGVEG